jgi:hypothetical protein
MCDKEGTKCDGKVNQINRNERRETWSTRWCDNGPTGMRRLSACGMWHVWIKALGWKYKIIVSCTTWDDTDYTDLYIKLCTNVTTRTRVTRNQTTVILNILLHNVKKCHTRFLSSLTSLSHDTVYYSSHLPFPGASFQLISSEFYLVV